MTDPFYSTEPADEPDYEVPVEDAPVSALLRKADTLPDLYRNLVLDMLRPHVGKLLGWDEIVDTFTGNDACDGEAYDVLMTVFELAKVRVVDLTAPELERREEKAKAWAEIVHYPHT